MDCRNLELLVMNSQAASNSYPGPKSSSYLKISKNTLGNLSSCLPNLTECFLEILPPKDASPFSANWPPKLRKLSIFCDFPINAPPNLVECRLLGKCSHFPVINKEELFTERLEVLQIEGVVFY